MYLIRRNILSIPVSKVRIKHKVKYRILALARWYVFKHNKKCKYTACRYQIWSVVLGDGIDGGGIGVDGYYEVDGIAIAFILHESKQTIFYW